MGSQVTLQHVDDEVGKFLRDLLAKHGVDPMDPNLKYKHMVKVQEELGELAEQVLKSDRLQRKEKGVFVAQELADEVGDSIFALFYLAKTMGLNIEELIRDKLKKNQEYLQKA